MQEPTTPNRSKAILFAGILLGGYISLLIGLVYLGQQHLRQSLYDQVHLTLEKQAAAVGYFLNEQKDGLQEFTRNPALNTFFANRALGMSMQYGLRASLLAVRDELERLISRKKLQGRSVYSRISFVDQDGSILVTAGEKLQQIPLYTHPVSESLQSVSLHIHKEHDVYHSDFQATIGYRDQVAGLLIAETNLIDVLTPLLKQSVNSEISNKLMLIGPQGEVLISTGQTDSETVAADTQDMILVPIAGSDYKIKGMIELGYGQSLLTSPWFLAALSLITFPVLGGLYYLLRLNNNHLLLQARYLTSIQQEKELQRFRKRLDLSSDMIVLIDPDTSRYQDINQPMCEFFSLSREELLDKRVIDLSGQYQTMEQWRIFLRQLREKGRLTVEDTGLHPNGKPFFIEINAHYAKDEEKDSIVAIFRDISERKQAELALQQANQRVTAVLDGIDAVVYVADMETHEVLYVNPTVKDLFGDVVGQTCWQTLQSGQTGPCSFCTNDKLLDANGNPRKAHIWEFQNQATGLWFHCSDRAIPWDDGRYVRLEVATDITDRIRDEKALQVAHQQLESLAYYDPLTKLANRRLFSDRLRQAFSRAHRTNMKLAVCYLDLDGFKNINDTLGHEVGDNLLVEVTNRLLNTLRSEDTVARWGGDEFALLISGQYDEEVCANTLERLLNSLSTPYEIEGQIFNVTASIGVTIYPQDQSDPDTLLRHADQAMYLAKQRGRNRYYFFDPDQDRRVHAHREHIIRIAEAIEHDELRLFYQPKVNMALGKVFGAEALVRWQHPEQGLLSPAAFLPTIEGHQVQHALDWWVLKTAIKQAALWHADELDLSVSINISPKTIQQPGFVDRLMQLIAHSAIDGSCIELEILESSSIDDLDAVSSVISQCAKFGVAFALDDYGTGYSSLTYIRRLPVQTLKIDQTFIRDMLKDQDDLNIVEGVIGLAKAFTRDVIAEGVENTEIGTQLLGLGCNLAQGYGIAKPMPAAEISGWLNRYRFPMEWLKTLKKPPAAVPN